MARTPPRSFAPHFRVAGYALGGLALLLLLLSLALRASPDARMQLVAQACGSLLPWLLGLALLCALLAYALRPADDVAPPSGDSTEFAPDATEFARSALHGDTRAQQPDQRR